MPPSPYGGTLLGRWRLLRADAALDLRLVCAGVCPDGRCCHHSVENRARGREIYRVRVTRCDRNPLGHTPRDALEIGPGDVLILILLAARLVPRA